MEPLCQGPGGVPQFKKIPQDWVIQGVEAFLSALKTMNLTLQAYAKINLTLEVLAKRDDGYHEVASILRPLAWQIGSHLSLV